MAIDLISLFLNSTALAVAGILYFALVKNLKAKSDVSDERINFWKDKATELEKQTPNYLVKSLSDRINVAEEEIERLNQEKGKHAKEIEEKRVEIQELNSERSKIQEYETMINDLLAQIVYLQEEKEDPDS